MKAFYYIAIPALIALFATMCDSHIEAHEGRVVYHSQCGVSANPVQYDGHSGTVSVRKWWYKDSVTGLDLYTQDKAVHEHCEAVKVLISTPAEIAVAEQLESTATSRKLAFFALWALIIFVWGQEGKVAERAAEKAAEQRRNVALEEVRQERETYRERLKAEQERSRKANADRAARKAARRAAHEARVAANLARRKK